MGNLLFSNRMAQARITFILFTNYNSYSVWMTKVDSNNFSFVCLCKIRWILKTRNMKSTFSEWHGYMPELFLKH